jgi:hypothetical protein
MWYGMFIGEKIKYDLDEEANPKHILLKDAISSSAIILLLSNGSVAI